MATECYHPGQCAFWWTISTEKISENSRTVRSTTGYWTYAWSRSNWNWWTRYQFVRWTTTENCYRKSTVLIGKRCHNGKRLRGKINLFKFENVFFRVGFLFVIFVAQYFTFFIFSRFACEKDDPMSSLDNEVAKWIFDNGIKKMLLRHKRTVILVTQKTHLIYGSDNVRRQK